MILTLQGGAVVLAGRGLDSKPDGDPEYLP